MHVHRKRDPRTAYWFPIYIIDQDYICWRMVNLHDCKRIIGVREATRDRLELIQCFFLEPPSP
ncbi:hypothetical protein D3C71_1368660 [compost metagenome]